MQYDMGGYYGFMQAFWINKDYTFKFLTDRPYHPKLVSYTNQDGTQIYLNKYSVGPAIMQTPFFLLGHLESYYQKVPRDGFSYTYIFWIITGCILYTFLALLILRKLLLEHFDDKVTASVLVLLAFGTNLWHYTVIDAMMSHAYSFFLFTLAIYCSQKWLEKGNLKYLISLALTCGMIGVTRMPNMVFFLVPVFWGVYNIDTLKNRFSFFLEKWQPILLGIGIFFIPFIPQSAYWYHMTGNLFINLYAENGEGLYWSQPMIAEVLIGYRKGWVIYTPAILLGFIGFYFLFRKYKPITPVLLLYLIINIYVVSCWGCWWYGGSFGMRALIESSVVLAFPMAALLENLYQGKVKSILAVLLIVGLITLNQIQSAQASKFVLHWDAMTRQAYWTIFCKIPPVSEEVIEERNKYLLHPNVGKESDREIYNQTIW